MPPDDDGLVRYPLPPEYAGEPTGRLTVHALNRSAPAPDDLGAASPVRADAPTAPFPSMPAPADAPPALAPPLALQTPPSLIPGPLTGPEQPPLPALPSLPGSPGAAQGTALTPVEHDPFEQTLKAPLTGQVLIPVDYDPFNPNDMATIRQRAAVHHARNAAPDDRSAIVRDFFDKIIGRNLKPGEERYQLFPERWARQTADTFGRAASGEFGMVRPDEHGMVSDEAIGRAREQMNSGADNASNFVMLGGPLNMAMRGARPGGATLGSGAGIGEGAPKPPPAKPAPVFHSAVEAAVDGASMKQASADQWLGTLKNAKGVKPEEMQWLGLEDWLKEQSGPVTKAQVAEYVRSHKVDLKEVHKFGEETDGFHEAVLDKAHDIMGSWFENSHRLARGEGITVERPLGRAGHGEQWTVKVDNKIIGRLNSKESADLYAKEFQHEAAKGKDADFNDFFDEVAHPASYPDLVAQHDQPERNLAGGENYREILLTSPPKTTDESRVFRVRGHWEEPNVLAWARADDRMMPRTFTPEETAAAAAHTAAEPELARLNAAQDDVARRIQTESAKLNHEHDAKVRADLKAGRITMVEARKQLEGYLEKPELKPLQEELAGIRAQEDTIRSKLPPKPPEGAKTLFLQEVQSDWHQRGREQGYKRDPNAQQSAAMEADFNAWKQKHGYLSDVTPQSALGHILSKPRRAGDEQLLREAAAWNAAHEANNPAVYQLSLDAAEARMARTQDTQTAWRESARPFLAAKARQHGRPGTIDGALPDSARGVTGLAEAGILNEGEVALIFDKSEEHLRSPASLAISERANQTQLALEAAERTNKSGVPDAPLKKSWHEMVLKRMIREAAEKGYEKLAWTTGDQQNKRWSLSTVVDALHYLPNEKRLLGYKGTSKKFEDIVPPEKLPEFIGKEAAEKLLGQPLTNSAGKPMAAGLEEHGAHILKGQDLEVGGSGMKGFYDKMLVDAANKITKPFGGRVTQGKINTLKGEPLSGEVAMERLGRLARQEFGVPEVRSEQTKWWRNATQAQRDEIFNRVRDSGETVHTLDITPAMRDAAIGKGFPLFMGGVPVTRIDHDPFAEDKRKGQ